MEACVPLPGRSVLHDRLRRIIVRARSAREGCYSAVDVRVIVGVADPLISGSPASFRRCPTWSYHVLGVGATRRFGCRCCLPRFAGSASPPFGFLNASCLSSRSRVTHDSCDDGRSSGVHCRRAAPFRRRSARPHAGVRVCMHTCLCECVCLSPSACVLECLIFLFVSSPVALRLTVTQAGSINAYLGRGSCVPVFLSI